MSEVRECGVRARAVGGKSDRPVTAQHAEAHGWLILLVPVSAEIQKCSRALAVVAREMRNDRASCRRGARDAGRRRVGSHPRGEIAGVRRASLGKSRCAELHGHVERPVGRGHDAVQAGCAASACSALRPSPATRRRRRRRWRSAASRLRRAPSGTAACCRAPARRPASGFRIASTPNVNASAAASGAAPAGSFA